MTDYTESFARTAEYELSRLADLAAELGVMNDPLASVTVHGLAAVANALLSLDEGVRSGTVDVANAVSDLSDRLADVEEAIGAASDRVARPRPWWRGASRDDRQAYAVARAALAALPADVSEDEFEAANRAVAAAASRLPWWQR